MISGNRQLPAGWRWAKLGNVCQLNPRRSDIQRSDAELTTFVPMAAVDEGGLGVNRAELKPYSQVRRGYTYFEEGDVLFAKITPCMQNGKHAIATGLTDGIGFGSTEFHVLRPLGETVAEWIHYFLLQPSVLDAATEYFTGAVGQQRLPESYLANLELPLPPRSEQQQIAALLREQLTEALSARTAIKVQRDTYDLLVHALVRDSLASATCQRMLLSDGLNEVTKGIGERWAEFPVLGATRAGLALAKEPVGKNPGRYKPVVPGTIFYNPMRILLGSIAMIDDDDQPGITSPDYVVVRGVEGKLHPRWFYHWFRSAYGAEFIKSLTRGAVRERLMFKRLAPAQISVPDWPTQLAVAAKLQEIKRAKTLLKQRLAEIERLPAALLRQAFGGEL